MSAYDNVVVGKLKLKGKALDVKAGGIKKKYDKYHSQVFLIHQGGNTLSMNEADKDGSSDQVASYDDVLTPAERRFVRQTEKLELRRLAKMASKSHRDRVQEFNRYLANLSEHYDIPKVGLG